MTLASTSRETQNSNIWQVYDAARYIPRETTQKALENWWRDADLNKRVATLTASPGCGKTWTMNHFRTWLEGQRPINGNPPIVLWLDLVNVAAPNDGINDKAVREWLMNLKEKLSKTLKIPGGIFDLDRAIEAIIEDFSVELCKFSKSPFYPILMIDGFDQYSEEITIQIIECILAPFLKGQFMHLIIAKRDPNLWRYPLRQYQQDIPLSRWQDDYLDQFKLFVKYLGWSDNVYQDNFTESLIKWHSQLSPHYQWNHPFINAYLFFQAFQCDGTDFRFADITPDHLRYCVRDLITRPQDGRGPTYPDLTSYQNELLLKLARWDLNGSFQWTKKEVCENLGTEPFNDPNIKRLISYGLICHGKNEEHWQVVDGLRELLCCDLAYKVWPK